VAEFPVVNASPLIHLAEAGLLGILSRIADRVLVPTGVAAEIRRKGDDDPTVLALTAETWLSVVSVPQIPHIIVEWDLGVGEAEVLAWAAAHPGTEAIIDDLSARRCARTLGIPVRGTLGLVLAARRRGDIPAARPVVDSLRSAGMFLSDEVIDAALSLVDE